ncbi:MAG: KpsF/GutQ family sugar-phosphate isomerase [Thermodesulfobacteriota bacterium]
MDKDSTEAVIEQAKEVLRIEADGVLKLVDRMNHRFAEMVELIFSSKGRLIISGIGKSGTIGRKIVGTLNSTGTRSLFIHPVEAMHGDLGMVSRDDIFLALSNSGETDELNLLIPSIRRIGCKVIAFTGKPQSTLAKNSDIVIDVGVEKEACPLGLAPTASTTALLAVGDALAVVLINKKRFKSSDFVRIHPGGKLGRRLACKVKQIMLEGESIPRIYEGKTMRDAVKEINRLQLGAALVSKPKSDILTGIVTDGDIRRRILLEKGFLNLRVEDVMTRNPRRAGPESAAYDALNLMEKHQITVLPITSSRKKILGILHLHDILGKGAFKFNDIQ